jgi:hypothetical protein
VKSRVLLPPWYTLEHALEDGYTSLHEALLAARSDDDERGDTWALEVEPEDYEAQPSMELRGRSWERVMVDYDNWNRG